MNPIIELYVLKCIGNPKRVMGLGLINCHVVAFLGLVVVVQKSCDQLTIVTTS